MPRSVTCGFCELGRQNILNPPVMPIRPPIRSTYCGNAQHRITLALRISQHVSDHAVSKDSAMQLAATVAVITGAASGIGLTRDTSWMDAQTGICCNAICPGTTATHIAETMPPERLDLTGSARAGEYAALIPAVLDPDDIANLALFLASNEARHINSGSSRLTPVGPQHSPAPIPLLEFSLTGMDVACCGTWLW